MPHTTDPATRARVERLFIALQAEVERCYSEWVGKGCPGNVEQWRACIVRALPRGIELTRMTARPFGFRFRFDADAEFQIACNARTYSWERVVPRAKASQAR